jgi:FAD:protein FMN transferase
MSVNRRRFITISAAAVAATSLGLVGSASAKPVRWRGTALGAQASLLLHHDDEQQANQIIAACVSEISRLENIFSLYRTNSALVQLNDKGILELPPLELIQAMADCRRISDLSKGAFDVTVQPLWQLYARHFSRPDADPAGPTAAEVTKAQALVDYRAVRIGTSSISFDKPGMAVTLNGFAQGFITDRIANMLRDKGLHNVLVDIGETRALDDHPSGRPWRVGIRNPQALNKTLRTLDISDQSVATSGGYGQRFQAGSQHHHLFDPATGASSDRYASVTVIAPLAATADALSTALSGLHLDQAQKLLRSAGATAALFLHRDGTFSEARA